MHSSSSLSLSLQKRGKREARAFLELIPPLPLLLLHPFRRRRRSEARNQSPNVYTSLGFRSRYSLGFSWRWVGPGSYELCWCARRGGRSSGAASSPIMLQIGGLSPRVASPTGHGVDDRKGLATPSSTSLASQLAMVAAGLSTNSFRNQVGSSVPSFLVVCFSSWVCLRPVSVLPTRRWLVAIFSSQEHLAALRYVDTIDMLFLVPIKTYVPSKSGLASGCGRLLRSPTTSIIGHFLQGSGCNFCFYQGCICKI